jgi:hypothetical protein
MSKSPSSFLVKLIYFFPIQLVLVHIKKNQQLLFFWLMLFMAIFGKMGLKYGIPYLFLAPEYLGELSFASYFIVGFAIGTFVVAFNLSSYIMDGSRFPFLATLSKPFFKYSLNNSFIPSIFIGCYLYLAHQFLSHNETFSQSEILFRLFGFLGGYLLFTISSTFYFLATNKDFEKLFGKDIAKVLALGASENGPTNSILQKKNKSWFENSEGKTWRVDSYLNAKLRLKATRPSAHYDKKMLSKVFRQNHVNASLFQLTLVGSFLILGAFREFYILIIPAGASVILLFTILLMLSSAIRSWTKGWTFVIILATLFGLNQLTKNDTLYFDSKAYGMSYKEEVDYLKSFQFPAKEDVQADLKLTIKRLENWKLQTGKEKPKAVFIATSGGGSRAAMWSFLAMHHLNQETNGELMRHMNMGTGSSGGMIGLAYFRELHSQNIPTKEKAMDMGKDILNPIIFTLAVHDALIRSHRFEQNGENHWKDRGYIFEKQLHQNTDSVLNKTLAAYRSDELAAKIPSLIVTPSSLDDSRRLLISNFPLRFLCTTNNENIDYQSFFALNDPDQINYVTVLRMNASFPYVLPSVSLPTEPKVEVFDAGLKDNFGMNTTINYINQLKDWFEKNTSGIVILQIKDGLDKRNKPKDKSQSIVSELLSPFGSLYGNWFDVQKYSNEELLYFLRESYSGKVELLEYNLNKSEDEYISLSWHLNSKEKLQIVNSVYLKENIETEARLKQLLN